MAVTLIRRASDYQCLSTDTKPVTGIKAGSRLFETDTGATWRFDGALWKKVTSAAIDNATYARTGIDYAHHEVHAGSAYWAANNATLGNGELNTASIVTHNSAKWAHLLLEISSAAVATFEVFEDVTSSDMSGGAAFTPLNFNRNSTNVSLMTAKVGDTVGADQLVPSDGTAIWTESLGTRGIVTTRENGSELILKQNTGYLFRITNGANANNCTILLNWYEHTDRES